MPWLRTLVHCHFSDVNVIPDAYSRRTPFKTAVELALTRIKDYEVETRWTNASTPGTPSQPLPTDPDWAGGSMYTDERVYVTSNPVEEVWSRVESIGGRNGYGTATWAWKLRGVMDSLIGGVGNRANAQFARFGEDGNTHVQNQLGGSK